MYEKNIQNGNELKILHIFREFNSGGVESFVMNLYQSLEGSGVHFDFLLRSRNNEPIKTGFFKRKGSCIYITMEYPRHLIANAVQTKKFFSEHMYEYDVVHIHANSLVYFLPIRLACKYMSKAKIIVHSHNTRSLSPLLLPIHFINRWRLKQYNTCNLACSKKAGKWMFLRKYMVIPNGIDTDAFTKKEHHSENGVLRLVSVGRLESQKNYSFIIPVIRRLIDNGIHVKYKIAGDGSRKERLKKEIAESGLNDHIMLLGNCHNIADILNDSDIFLMPSLYEGLGIAHMEAQCIGIPCILSDRIPREGCICSNVVQVPLVVDKWVEVIQTIACKKNKSYVISNHKRMENCKFSLQGLGKSMKKIYGIG